MLCLVDDVQRVDGPPAGVLAFVIRRLREEPVVVLAAVRADPGAPILIAERTPT